MPDPKTSNILLAVPTRGTDVGTWDTPVNGDFSSIDGHIGGVQTIGLSNINVTLTSPSGSVTPSPGPTQAENAVIRLTGTLTGNVRVTLPLPGPIIIENLTTGNFVASFAAAGVGEIIATRQGTRKTVYSDGTNVRFVNGTDPGAQEFWAGITSMPTWVTACTVKPYLLLDDTIYSFSDFPFLGSQMGSAFGGNGITTFGVPDMRGRVPLAYDGTGTRITTAGSGINGQTMGAAGGGQNQLVAQANLPNLNFNVTIPAGQGSHLHGGAPNGGNNTTTPGGSFGAGVFSGTTNVGLATLPQMTGTAASGGSATPVTTVPPAQVAGIWVIKT